MTISEAMGLAELSKNSLLCDAGKLCKALRVLADEAKKWKAVSECSQAERDRLAAENRDHVKERERLNNGVKWLISWRSRINQAMGEAASREADGEDDPQDILSDLLDAWGSLFVETPPEDAMNTTPPAHAGGSREDGQSTAADVIAEVLGQVEGSR